MVEKITFEVILSVWKSYLWADRTSTIESTSAMIYLGGYDTKNMEYTPTFFGYFIDGKLAGVNSGHQCVDRMYRSRGLYVMSEHRGKGIGTELLLCTIEQARVEECALVWSYPKQTSWKTYQAAGFSLASPWELSELGHNAYCYLRL